MIPMSDPSMLFVITPALLGVTIALLAGVAAAIAGTYRELHRLDERATPFRPAAPAPPSPAAGPCLAA
jgi:hypothetical protein